MTAYLHPTSRLAAEFWADGKSASCPVIDMHAHMGPFSGIHFPLDTPAKVAEHMAQTGVRLVCFAHHDAIGSPEISNRTALEAVRACPDKFRAYLTVNPNYPEDAKREFPLLDSVPQAFMGFKLHPSMHSISLDDPKYEFVLSLANERRLPVLIHTWGGTTLCGATQVRRVAEKYPDTVLILGHALFGTWEEGGAVTRDHANTYLELTAVVGRRGVVEMLVTQSGSDRILFGTDLPWFDEHHYIGNILAADITDEDRHNILHRNAERILKAAGIKI